jgi:GNAT superfamily N-acetyltransferase
MNKYSVRPAAQTDIEEVHALIAKQNTLDYGGASKTMDELRTSWQSLNLEDDTCIAYVDGKLAGYAELLDNDSPFIYLEDRNNVDLAFQLLIILEKKAISRKKDRVNLFTRVSEKNKTLLGLFASNGYRSDLSFLIMELVIEKGPPAPQYPDGLTVRTFIKGQDAHATYRADEEAAEDKGYHDPLSYEGWVKRMRMDRESFDPNLWFLACEASEVVGVALNVLHRETDVGWVDHLGVRRAWRKRGIGKALLLHSFGEFHKRGIRKIKLSVDSKSLTNAPRLYESVGMNTIQQYHIYRKEI